MAANSKRERIIISDLTLIQGVSAVKTPIRTIPQYKDLQEFALTQFPVVAVVGRLPVPEEKHSSRVSARVDLIKSRLVVDSYVYLMANENADTEIYSLMDDLWVALYADPSRGDLVTSTELEVQEDVQKWAPFLAFRFSIIHYYFHDTGGI